MSDNATPNQLHMAAEGEGVSLEGQTILEAWAVAERLELPRLAAAAREAAARDFERVRLG